MAALFSVKSDGTIWNGHHRIAELQRRIGEGTISPNVQIRIEQYNPKLPSSGFWY
jgi:hypothetical protein